MFYPKAPEKGDTALKVDIAIFDKGIENDFILFDYRFQAKFVSFVVDFFWGWVEFGGDDFVGHKNYELRIMSYELHELGTN